MRNWTKRNWRQTVVLVALAAGLAQSGGVALAREHSGCTLSGPSGSSVVGRARLVMKNAGDGRLVLMVRGLTPDQTYDILIGDVKVGTLQANGGGGAAVRFRTRPHGNDLVLGFDPHGALVTLRSATGEDVLVGTLPTSTTSTDGTVACCVPDDSGAECEMRTADECTARGGTAAAATSCLPNPCDNAPPVQTDIVCCIPDDSGPACEDRTAAECATAGGVVVAASSCTPNPCAATPPADPEIQCCIPDDSGAECEDRTEAQCAAQGGTNMGPGTCTPNPCAVSTPTGGDDSGHHDGSTSTSSGRRGGEDTGSVDRGGGNTRPGYYGSPSVTPQRATVQALGSKVDDHGGHGADDPAGDDHGRQGK